MTKFPITEHHACDIENDEEYEPVLIPFSGDISLSGHSDGCQKGICLHLDGKTDSSLDWNSQIEKASLLMESGVHILWNLDLGLFKGLKSPLKDETQLQSLKLSLQHFKEAIWDRFKTQTIGVCIYEDTVTFEDLSEPTAELTLPLDEWVRENQVAGLTPNFITAYRRRDVVASYLSLLTASVPEGLRLFVRTRVPEGIPLSVAVALMNPDCFDKIEWLVEAPHPLNSAWRQEGDVLVPSRAQSSPVGMCIPMREWKPQAVNQVDVLLAEFSHLRLIPEASIISSWEQLDRLFVVESELTSFGRRQLQGFQAAGGEVSFV